LREKSEKLAGGGGDDDESDDSSDGPEVEEELGYFSPLDNVDPYASFKRALTGMHYFAFPDSCADLEYYTAFQMQNSHVYQAATTSLTVEQQTLLMEIMRIADTQASDVAVQA
jgi:importin-7